MLEFPKKFFSRRIPIFHNVAMLVLCIVFFLLPFALRGARMAVGGIQNNVADWLPKHYEETVDLVEFRKYFQGDAFVVVSGPWCKEGNSNYTTFRRKVYEESLEYESVLREQNATEVIRAHQVGDELGLLTTGNYHQDWGRNAEKWIKGKKQKWYFINRRGELYEWDGQNNVVDGIKRFFERMADGRNQATGKFIDRFGLPPEDNQGSPNTFYENPELLFARPFKTVVTGPDALAQMAGPKGTLRIGDVSDDDAAAFDAFIEGNQRLTGALFGPTPSREFKWTYESLLQYVDDRNLLAQLKSSEVYRSKFDRFLKERLTRQFENDLSKLLDAPEATRLEIWLRMWDEMGLNPPPRQTCLIVTINDPFLEELDRIVGSDWVGKPRGRLLELAITKVGLEADSVYFGGPPSDNVAIDEEGTKTLLRLASFSGLIGLFLSYYCFRSLRATVIMFFVSGMSAIASLSYVWYFGSRLDAILMTMPSLIYVLALSATVHLINYYRDAAQEVSKRRAVDIAMSHGLFPCTLAALTTAIGLFSLCTSQLAPIWKFGFFSGIAVLATLFFLFTFVPASLTNWPPPYQRRSRNQKEVANSTFAKIEAFWMGVYEFVTRRHRLVLAIGVICFVVFGYGLTKIQTTVQLLKLFDKDSKVLKDYTWMEANLGKLVPMEILVNVDQRAHLEHRSLNAAIQPAPETETPSANPQLTTLAFDVERALKYSFLERLEISARVRKQLERYFGPDQLNIVGSGMSSDVFVPLQFVDTQLDTGSTIGTRYVFNSRLTAQRDAMIAQDYLDVADKRTLAENRDTIYSRDPHYDQREMWRISLRLAALEDVDYGQFVNDLKMVVEPIMAAYAYRTEILRQYYTRSPNQIGKRDRFVLIGRNPDLVAKNLVLPRDKSKYSSDLIDQSYLFSATLKELLENRGVERRSWIDVAMAQNDDLPTLEEWADLLKTSACVIFVEDSPFFDIEFARQHAPLVIDCRQHKFDKDGREAWASSQTAMNRKTLANEDLTVTATYTGIVPIVYKAQGALLQSLIESILLSFVLISIVMMVVLRNWNSPFGLRNSLNLRAGMISMIPNTFPLVIVFGFMGFFGQKVDIGSMMTASVAMGIAVDDTVHFLNWYRYALADGMSRKEAIRLAYQRCAPAMTQTTLIAGLGLSVFAFSTFAPTQRFGVLMLILLVVALIGDLLILPAILSSRLGKFFGTTSTRSKSPQGDKASESTDDQTAPDIVEFPTNISPEKKRPSGDDHSSNRRRKNS